ncbi:N-acetyltransferase [Altererythrobacter sp. RZ02]|uniref:N-acetyltransferase n=1 Tax=Pontixanthobacter rizhaonensis TaxID=2730337 RepID=A0A848QSH3_9SPHN|nr:N-acetyltransferase [Pontixanthobacter rizhaonensis]NMW32446.1 N-acetyltransferase [Pontixanthobacter rizhaonensis]
MTKTATHEIAIRHEQPEDVNAIYALTEAAFRTMPFSDGDEHHLVNGLRNDGDLTLSLVAESNDKAIIGHIAFSPVTISDGTQNWYGLGPISVIPLKQSFGIGSALVNRGIAEMEQRGARGIILLGSPEYYSRFGFEHDPELQYPGPPAEYFQRLVISGDRPSGIVQYAKAFR